MRGRLITTAVVLLLSLYATPAGAQSDEKLGGYKDTYQDDDGDVVLVVERDGTVRQPQTRGGTFNCRIYDVISDDEETEVGGEAGDLQEGTPYWLMCDRADGTRLLRRLFTQEGDTPAISAEELAARATSQLPLVYPEPHTNPGITLNQLVGIDTWLWIDADQWQPISATASIPGLSISAVATPQTMTWDMDDGTVVTCDGPGTPYDQTIPEFNQSTECSHLYQSRGDYTATATITWSISWTSSDGDGGDLADASRTTQFTMNVTERQAIGR